MLYDYATIMQNVERIRQAIYGEEVRGSIADSIEMMAGETKDIESFREEILTKVEEINKINVNAEVQEARQGLPTLSDKLDEIQGLIKEVGADKQNKFITIVETLSTQRASKVIHPLEFYNVMRPRETLINTFSTYEIFDSIQNSSAIFQLNDLKKITGGDSIRMEVRNE